MSLKLAPLQRVWCKYRAASLPGPVSQALIVALDSFPKADKSYKSLLMSMPSSRALDLADLILARLLTFALQPNQWDYHRWQYTTLLPIDERDMLQGMWHEIDETNICSHRIWETLPPNKISEILNIPTSKWEHDEDLQLQYLDIDSVGK